MKRALFVVLVLFGAARAAADPFPERVMVDGVSLLRNGRGTRVATLLGVKVYDAALYLIASSDDPEAALSGEGRPRQLRLVYRRDVPAEKVKRSWEEGFRANVPLPDRYGREFKTLIHAMGGARKGDKVVLTFSKDEVRLEGTGIDRLAVGSPGFPRALLSIWLGERPTDEALKKALLGG